MTTIDRLPSLLAEAANAARNAYAHAMATLDGIERRRTVGPGADGTETYLLDVIVERPILDVLDAARVNVLSEEVGWIDRGSAVTIVMDPVDGTANAAAGIPICGFAAAAVIDDRVEFARVEWFDVRRTWTAVRGKRSAGVSMQASLDGASLSMLRPRATTRPAWHELADRADRIRVLGASVLEAGLVADGSIDAFCDPGGDVHRIVDVAATSLIVENAGGHVCDVWGRPFTFDPDLSRRWSGVFASSPDLAEEIVDVVTRHAPAPLPLATSPTMSA
ncbi:MAG: myo-inositol-1(or 4)-monophosphatase [Ilumatobacter sp.]|jgi:myo-inositol-1(or 4)-monophosphatase